MKTKEDWLEYVDDRMHWMTLAEMPLIGIRIMHLNGLNGYRIDHMVEGKEWKAPFRWSERFFWKKERSVVWGTLPELADHLCSEYAK